MIFESSGIDPERPGEVVTACIESGARHLLLDSSALPPEFYDLSTGVLGVVVQRATQYDIRLAAVIVDLESRSDSFQRFADEANRAGRHHFGRTRELAIRWIEDDLVDSTEE